MSDAMLAADRDRDRPRFRHVLVRCPDGGRPYLACWGYDSRGGLGPMYAAVITDANDWRAILERLAETDR